MIFRFLSSGSAGTLTPATLDWMPEGLLAEGILLRSVRKLTTE